MKKIFILIFLSFSFTFLIIFFKNEIYYFKESILKPIENTQVIEENSVNYFNDINNNSEFKEVFFESYNESAYTSIKSNNIKVCVYDSFDTENRIFSHGNLVSLVINKNYDGDLLLFDRNDYNLNDLINYDCDVINYSMSIHEENRTEKTFEDIKNFLTDYNGLLIVAAGNEGTTSSQSQFSQFKKDNPSSELNNKVIIVGQLFMMKQKNSKIIWLKTSFGPEIDILVMNGNDNLFGKKLSGTSFAAPVVTSVVANLLSTGYNQSDIRNFILDSGKKIRHSKIDYTYLDMSETYNLAEQFSNKEKNSSDIFFKSAE